MTEVEQQPPPQNGIDLSAAEFDDESSKARPADIEQDMREMERRKRVEAIMGSKLFREELERIVDSARDGGGILQQLSDIMGVPNSTRVGNVFKATNCMLPINDIRGVESMGYAKGEKILRCKLAATFRLLDLYGWTQGLGAQITARLKVDQENFLVNPYGMMHHEITASSLNKVDMQGQIVEQGTTNFGVNRTHFALHSVVHAARPDIRCAIYIGCTPVVAVSSLKVGLLPVTRDACVLGEVTTHTYTGTQMDGDERDRLVRALGPNSKVLILSNYGALCCGETIEEAFFAASHIVKACETQLQLLPVGVDNLVLIPEESRKAIYTEARRPPEDLEKKFAAAVATVEAANASNAAAEAGGAADGGANKAPAAPKWRVGGAEFEALMRMLDNAGYRTGYIYRHPLIKTDPPKPKNDVELPPAVSSLGYLLEEEEMLKQGIWKKGAFGKGGDRSRWLNSPNVYQKVEVLETGTPDPKKITKWVADGSPSHSTPVRIEDALQFVPAGTNPKEFKRLQQQIKDNRRADKISAGPQSHILEGVTWDEANRIKDATVSSAGDHVVLMGAASKGIIQRGFQHNAAVYKAPYAKNPFDNVTDDELNEYKRTVERKKKSIHGEYTDTDFSESEALSSMPISAPPQQQTKQIKTVSHSEPEDIAEHQVMRIQTQQAPIPSQPEVVLSDATLNFINGERSHTAVNRKPPTGRDIVKGKEEEETAAAEVEAREIRVVEEEEADVSEDDEEIYANSTEEYETIVENMNARIYNNNKKQNKNKTNNNNNNNNKQFPTAQRIADEATVAHNAANDAEYAANQAQSNKENIYRGSHNINNNNNRRNVALIAELKNDALFQRQKYKLPHTASECTIREQEQREDVYENENEIEIEVEVERNVRGSRCRYDKIGLIVDKKGCGEVGAVVGNVNSALGFRPIHPAALRADANEMVMQQPAFSNRCQHQQQQIQSQLRQCQQNAPEGAITLPHFEQAFGHLLAQSANSETNADLSAAMYCWRADKYAAPPPSQLYYELPPFYEREDVTLNAQRNAAASTAATSTATTTTAELLMEQEEEEQNPYKKSIACCTPAVCDSIFATLRKPYAHSDNNLIFNIPFTAETPDSSSASTKTMSARTTPRKTRYDMPPKGTNNNKTCANGKSVGKANNSPYRTLSHFGFNSPQRDPQPDHKHIPRCSSAEPKQKYKSLRKSISYEEIFSSPRYVDLCEYCFEKIVRLKPEIAQQTRRQTRTPLQIPIQTQMRLRNLCDYNGCGGGGGSGLAAAGRCHSADTVDIMYQPTGSETTNPIYDYVEYASYETSSTTTSTEDQLPPPLYTSQLEPVLEEELLEEVVETTSKSGSQEDGSKQLACGPLVPTRTPSNSSFIEKIMRLNYSEESASDWNYAQAPHKVVSCTNLTLELERALIEEESQREKRELSSRVETRKNEELTGAVTKYVKEDGEKASFSAQRFSVTEIWEFMQYEDQKAQYEDYSELRNEYHADKQNGRSQEEGYAQQQAETQTPDAQKGQQQFAAFTSPAPPSADGGAAARSDSDSENRTQHRRQRRSFMTREERTRRKLIFQELWEDHISFLDGKELNSLSDTESAIDGQQEQRLQQQQQQEREDELLAEEQGACALQENVSDGGHRAMEESNSGEESNNGKEQQTDAGHTVNERNDEPLKDDLVQESSATDSAKLAVPLEDATTQAQPTEEAEAEIFDSRSIICDARQTRKDLNKTISTATLTQKLQRTEIRRFSLDDLATRRGKSDMRTPGESEEDKVTFDADVKAAREEDGRATNDNSQDTKSKEDKNPLDINFEPHKLTSPAILASILTQTKPENINTTPAEESVNDDEEKHTSCVIKDQTQNFKSKETMFSEDEKEVGLHAQAQKMHGRKEQSFTGARSRSLPASQSRTTCLNSKDKLSLLSNQSYGGETERPPTPKPPLSTMCKQRRLSFASHEPSQQHPTLYEINMEKLCSVAGGELAPTSERDDDQSARTYNLNVSREYLFFPEEDQLVHSTANVACGRTDREANKVARRAMRKEDDLETERAEKDASVERFKAGMVLPTDCQQQQTRKTNPNIETAATVSRVAQLTAEALREPPTNLCASADVSATPSSLTKETKKKMTNELVIDHEAFTSLRAEYKMRIDEYDNFKRNTSTASASSPTTTLTSPKLCALVEEDVVDDEAGAVSKYPQDSDEMQFGELVESDEHEDLTKLNEEFEELLLNVENLQTTEAGTREHGGAETSCGTPELEEEECEDDEMAEGDELVEIEVSVDESEESNDADEQTADGRLNRMECRILRKIRKNQLKDCSEIFDKIEMTIRNKVTPSQLEQLARERSFNELNASAYGADEAASGSTFIASTPERNVATHSDGGFFGSGGLAESAVKVEVDAKAKAEFEIEAEADCRASGSATAHALEPSNSGGITFSVVVDVATRCDGEYAEDDDESSTLTPNGSRNYSQQSSFNTSSQWGAEYANTNAPDSAAAVVETYSSALKLRRSRSLTPSAVGKQLRQLSPPPAKLNKTQTIPTTTRQVSKIGSARSTKQCETNKTKVAARTISKWPRASCSTPEMKSTKRNFILENIRKASVPRHLNVAAAGSAAGGHAAGIASPTSSTASRASARANAQAIFCKNPFEPTAAASKMMLSHASNSSLMSGASSSTTASASSSRTFVKSRNNIKRSEGSSKIRQTAANKKQISPRNSNSSSTSGIYTFQSKLVRGSPRFWVSLTQSNGKKLQTQKRRRRSQERQWHCHQQQQQQNTSSSKCLETNDSTGDLADCDTEVLDGEAQLHGEHEDQELNEAFLRQESYVEPEEKDPWMSQELEDQGISQGLEDQGISQGLEDQGMIQELENQMMSQELEDQGMSQELEDQGMIQELENQMISQELEDQMMSQELKNQMMSQELEDQMMSQELEDQIMSRELEYQGMSQELQCQAMYANHEALKEKEQEFVEEHDDHEAQKARVPHVVIKTQKELHKRNTKKEVKREQKVASSEADARRQKKKNANPLLDFTAAQESIDDKDEQRCEAEGDADGGAAAYGGGSGGVDHELAALGAQIQQIEPRLDRYEHQMHNLSEHMATCTRHMDDCVAEQGELAENQRQLREQMLLQQYAEHIMCQVNTYSIYETED